MHPQHQKENPTQACDRAGVKNSTCVTFLSRDWHFAYVDSAQNTAILLLLLSKFWMLVKFQKLTQKVRNFSRDSAPSVTVVKILLDFAEIMQKFSTLKSIYSSMYIVRSDVQD